MSPPKYESNVSPPSRPFGTGPAAGTLGIRNQTSLEAAFIGGAITAEQQRVALETARAVMIRPEDFATPGAGGQNPDFPQYSRDFIPKGPQATSPEYTDPRVKPIDLSEEERNRLKLGNAFTPTIASPGEGNGVDPNALRGILSTSTRVLQAVQAGPDNLDNPANEAHSNTDALTRVTNVGAVRRFRLGVGSGATTGTSPEGARGQFPRPV